MDAAIAVMGIHRRSQIALRHPSLSLFYLILVLKASLCSFNHSVLSRSCLHRSPSASLFVLLCPSYLTDSVLPSDPVLTSTPPPYWYCDTARTAAASSRTLVPHGRSSLLRLPYSTPTRLTPHK
ncbi:hypothetical protein DFH06DRAFT_210385 [Mycena polygramma]|nr:hypothetical protein DFH06DRAFT_210385 [Mycena polygramma]